MLPQNEIQALFQLIDDPDVEVYEAVAREIVAYGKDIIPSLEHLWETTPDEPTQDRIASLIHRVHFQELQIELKHWVSVPQPEILRGAILVAKYQYPEMNVPFLLTQFEQMRKNLWLELNNYLTPIEKINVFNGILFNYYKLQGHELTSRKPEYFFINKLLESKQGNPYAIGVLYLALAELLDVPVFAVSIPRQFLLAYIDSLQHFYAKDDYIHQISFFIDPMNGMIYTHNDVEHYLHRIQADRYDRSFYEAQQSVRVIYKMLSELRQCYSMNNEEEKAGEIMTLMQIIKSE